MSLKCTTVALSEDKVAVMGDRPVPPHRKTHITCYYSHPSEHDIRLRLKDFTVGMLVRSQQHAN